MLSVFDCEGGTQPLASKNWVETRPDTMKKILFLILSTYLPYSVLSADLPGHSWVKPQKLFEVGQYCEGIVFDHAGNGYISHGDRITQFSLEGKTNTWAITGMPNGHKILADGTHLVCDASHKAVLHLDASGKIIGKASSECDGIPLKGPNDLTLDPKGGFYFTDPGGSSLTNPIGSVYYVDPSGRTHWVAGDLAFPNGIVLSPGRTKLYVAESQKNRIWVYTLEKPGEVTSQKVFAYLPSKREGQIDNQPDGMCLDADGNLYVAHYGMREVQVLNPKGELIRRYAGGNITTSNVAFGGPKWESLFITGGLDNNKGGLFVLDLKTKGRVILPPKPEK
jgi:gluconolactonase